MLSLKVEPLFQAAQPERERQREHQVAGRQRQVTLQRAVGDGVDVPGSLGELVDGDDREERRVFDERDELADQRWQGQAQGLRENDVTVGLRRASGRWRGPIRAGTRSTLWSPARITSLM